MEEPLSVKSNKTNISINKRLFYFLIFLVIAVPVIVGVVVWKLTDNACTGSQNGSHGEGMPILGGTTSGPDVTSSNPPDVVIQEPWKNLRLPKHVKPIHYDITLYPDFYNNNGWFYGNETVELNVTQATNVILIHTNYMNVTRTTLQKADGASIAISRTFWYPANQFWVVQTMEPMHVGIVLLRLQFDGSLTRAIVGFYKSTYKIGTEERHLASSKFQPVDARRAFPCMDEPNIKAEYTVTLVHRPGYIALSNMPETKTVPWLHDTSLHATHFNRSVPMSTYLVCFVVCDFANITDVTQYGTTIRVFATPDKRSQAEYALKVMKKSMERFQQLFNVPFPLPKNDMIAIPNFVSGAMEHWGLITYREVNMLYDEKEASAANKQRVAVVVAHEIAHMWFGNIVTMDWWDDLWLNEGFASFVEYLGVDVTEPEWEMMDQMIVDDVKPVMVTDAGVNSHPIVVDVSHPDQINEVFDAISYSKGAAILRMLQEVLGSERFFRAISDYLVKYKWATATTDDLWAEMGQVNDGYTVKDVMDTWTLQMGLPFVNLTFSPIPGGQGSVVTATQHRFLADRTLASNESESKFRYRWYIHLDFMEGTMKKAKWITKDVTSVTFNLTTGSYVKFNVNDTGFYRVNYPNDVWLTFAGNLDQNGPNAVPFPADRTGLIDDAFNLARGGYLNYDVALSMMSYLNKEFHHLPWDSAYEGITYIKHMFANSPHFDLLRRYVVMKTSPVLNRIGWEGATSSHLDKLLRSNIIELACEFGDTLCMDNATSKFRSWLDNGTVYVYKEYRVT
ncbi:hypothetical protein DPMN_023616 [Dreissena polymorpha]|uniref:Aminopeptidase n=1 Tax=Dreissena polymorpha TaxID=45954 RepID=A0A9D4RAW0_DREPO|nr:hypothetical protein DPMN_023616 [Dreissena polymorpha]